MYHVNNKQNQTSDNHAHTRHCDIDGCAQAGEYKAPKSIDNLRDYQWLCLEHVKEHNKKWNYFDGMERDEIEDFMHDAVTGHRPTWKREDVASIRGWQTKLEHELDAFLFGAHAARNRAKEARQMRDEPDRKTRDALALLALESPATMLEIKTSYRNLVKKFHPDLNGGSKAIEEKFKQITEAYQYLKTNITR